MANQGAHIRDVHTLEELNDRIESTGKEMANIEQEVSNYLNNVMDNLNRQLEYLREKLEEAQKQLEQAEQALSSCQAFQVFVPEVGGYVPSCISEEAAVSSARAKVAECQRKYQEGQSIVNDCQREIAEYNGAGGGKQLILNMANNQTPKAMEKVRICIEKLEDILATDIQGLQSNLENMSSRLQSSSSKSPSEDSRFDAFRGSIQKKMK